MCAVNWGISVLETGSFFLEAWAGRVFLTCHEASSSSHILWTAIFTSAVLLWAPGSQCFVSGANVTSTAGCPRRWSALFLAFHKDRVGVRTGMCKHTGTFCKGHSLSKCKTHLKVWRDKIYSYASKEISKFNVKKYRFLIQSFIRLSNCYTQAFILFFILVGYIVTYTFILYLSHAPKISEVSKMSCNESHGRFEIYIT